MFKNSSIILILSLLLSFTTQAKFENQSELSVLLTSGNTDVNLYNFKTTSSFTLEKYSFEFGGHFTEGENNGVSNAKDWDINAKVSRKLGKKFKVFYSTKYEHNFFAGIAYRFNNDLGTSFYFLETEKTKLKAEAGYRLVEQKLIEGPVENTFSQGRLYTEVSKQQTKDFFVKFWVEYLPNFTESDDWQLNAEPSLNFAMSSLLSLKLGYLYRYDNVVPTGLKKYDTQYSTTFIAKF